MQEQVVYLFTMQWYRSQHIPYGTDTHMSYTVTYYFKSWNMLMLLEPVGNHHVTRTIHAHRPT